MIFEGQCSMRRNLFWMFAGSLVMVALPALAQDKAKPKVTFQDQASAIFKNRCNSCHNADKQKGGLNLESFTTAMAGGSSGKVIEPGDPDNSTLLGLVMQTDEPKMPPNSPKIPDAEIAILRQWIEGGALDNSGSKAMIAAKPKNEFKLDPNSIGKPSGEPAMPVAGLSTEPIVVSPMGTAITALASSPWAPLIAIGSHKQILMYHADQGRLMAVIPFPEGFVYSLRFSRNGDLLLAAGGRGGQSGLAVAYDVKTGKRLFDVGHEYDVVLAADISPDHGLVAIGGPSKIVKVFNTADGSLAFEMKKHTEWVTALEFSPDGVLLATGDRNGGLLVWEGQTGREFYDLRGHAAKISDVSWRLDSNVVASSSEDGTVRLWEMANGNQIKSWGAHGGGTLSVSYSKDGSIVTTGRDRMTRLWDGNGGKVRDFEAFNDLALTAKTTHDSTKVIATDYLGEVRSWNLADGARIMTLASNPQPVAQRIVAVKAQLDQVKAQQAQVTAQVAPIQVSVKATTDALAAANAKMAPLVNNVNQATALMKTAEGNLAAQTAAEQKATTDLQNVEKALAEAQAAKNAADAALAQTTAAQAGAVKAVDAARASVVATATEKAAIDQQLAEVTAALSKAPNRAEVDKLMGRMNELVILSVAKATTISATVSAQAQRLSESEAATVAVANAQKAVADAPAKVAAAQAAVDQAKVAHQKVVQLKAETAKALEAAKAGLTAATNAANAVKPEIDAATAAKTNADKALADKQAELAKVNARVLALDTEFKALTEELKTKPTKDVAANSAPPAR